MQTGIHSIAEEMHINVTKYIFFTDMRNAYFISQYLFLIYRNTIEALRSYYKCFLFFLKVHLWPRVVTHLGVLCRGLTVALHICTLFTHFFCDGMGMVIYESDDKIILFLQCTNIYFQNGRRNIYKLIKFPLNVLYFYWNNSFLLDICKYMCDLVCMHVWGVGGCVGEPVVFKH